VSCSLEVNTIEGEIQVKGHSCKRGIDFGKAEYTEPKRMLTTTVKIEGSRLKRLPVISTGEIPMKEIIKEVERLYKVTVKAPVKRGEVILSNVCDSGVDIVASRTIYNN